MNSGRLSFQVTSKFIALYTKLIDGLSPHQIAPRESHEQFFTNLFNLEVKAGYLRDELNLHARDSPVDDVRKTHALETLSIVLRCILNKNPSGWEVMEILGGGVGQSDDIFLQFADLVNFIIGDELAPANIQHQGTRVALVYMCAIGQLSPGAYLLRRDLFPSIAGFIKRSSTIRFTAEASLLLAVLVNFHKSDAAKLNPYLKCIRNTQDKELMVKMCWAINSELVTSIKGYRDISDDSLRSPLATTLGSVFSSLRPDRALSITTAEPSRELFKNQPGAEAVFLLPIFELLRGNALFPIVVLENTLPGKATTGSASQLLHTILTLSSCVNLPSEVAAFISTPGEKATDLNCIHICYRVVWYLQNSRSRIEYEWKDLWNALVGLLGFLATKLDSLDTTGGVEQIIREYELIRSGSILKNQQTLLASLTIAPKAGTRQAAWIKRSTEALASITEMIGFYEDKVGAEGARTAQAAMNVLAGEIEVNGLHMARTVEAQIP
ncbi:hypothetical protein H0H92_002110 [Tricholoma furcatifolium]|nr:hypothetical protein H0H92_002110 [Tricholoma furcatifolium]